MSVVASILVGIVVPLTVYIAMKQSNNKLAVDLPSEREGESSVRRSSLSKDLIANVDPSVDTMFMIMKAAAKKFASKKQVLVIFLLF